GLPLLWPSALGRNDPLDTRAVTRMYGLAPGAESRPGFAREGLFRSSMKPPHRRVAGSVGAPRPPAAGGPPVCRRPSGPSPNRRSMIYGATGLAGVGFGIGNVAKPPAARSPRSEAGLRPRATENSWKHRRL